MSTTHTHTVGVAGAEVRESTTAPASRKPAIALLATLAWSGSAAVTAWWPAADIWPHTRELLVVKLLLAALSAAIVAASRYASAGHTARAAQAAARAARPYIDACLAATPWLFVLALGVSAWEIATAQLEWLPRPFFAPPQALISVYADDLPRLAASVVHSLVLLVYGYLLGALTGFMIGVSIGWSRAVGYWLHPVLRLVGPLPATAWLPLAFFFFPSSFSASVFLIALATAFPVAVLTWSGVASVNSAYYDVARTLGARPSFLVFRVAIPAALPSVFVGLFMGLGASFAVLVVAEMMG
jgi:NitT/TauT family transport system permease protein